MKQIVGISDLTPDAHNANRGTERGTGMLERSLEQFGAGRSILVDAEGRVVAGNKTLEQAAALGLPVRVVQTDGKELVAVQRTDLDLSDPTGMARKLAYADNRTSEVGLDWDIFRITEDVEQGLDLSGLWSKKELDALLGAVDLGDSGAELEQQEASGAVTCPKCGHTFQP